MVIGLPGSVFTKNCRTPFSKPDLSGMAPGHPPYSGCRIVLERNTPDKVSCGKGGLEFRKEAVGTAMTKRWMDNAEGSKFASAGQSRILNSRTKCVPRIYTRDINMDAYRPFQPASRQRIASSYLIDVG